jgi:hypothetical protein
MKLVDSTVTGKKIPVRTSIYDGLTIVEAAATL